MKSAVIAMVLALGLGASATIKIEYGPNGSFKAISTPDEPAGAHRRLVRSSGCSPCHNRCGRAVSSAPPEFCSSFLAATYTAPSDFAPVQTQCVNNASRVSAACSCFVQPTPSTSTTVTSSTQTSSTASETTTAPSCGGPGTACTLSNFVETCCGKNGLPISAGGDSTGCYFPTGDPQAGICFV